MTGSDSKAIERLAAFVSETGYDDIPADEQLRAKSRILDALISTYAGRTSDASALALAQAHHWARSDGEAQFWLSNLRGRVEDVSFVNSILVHSILLDDLPVHAGCVTIPVALALAEVLGASGAALIAAVAIGYEIELRMDLDHFSHRLMAKGFRHSSINACYAAMATAASMKRLSRSATASAFGLTTALLNPGTMEPMGKAGSSERFVQMAGNARVGVLAATLAETGFAGSRETFDGQAGLFSTYDGKAAYPAGMADGLGQNWHLAQVAMKPYPSSGAGTLPIYCAEKAARSGLDIDKITSMRLFMRPWAPMEGAVYSGPFDNAEQAMVSAKFGVAATLSRGGYNYDTVVAGLNDPVVNGLASRIDAIAAPESISDPGQAALEVTLVGGQTLRFDAGDMPKSMAFAPDWAAMIDRFERLTPSLVPQQRAQVIATVEHLDQHDTCIELLRCLQL